MNIVVLAVTDVAFKRGGGGGTSLPSSLWLYALILIRVRVHGYI